MSKEGRKDWERDAKFKDGCPGPKVWIIERVRGKLKRGELSARTDDQDSRDVKREL